MTCTVLTFKSFLIFVSTVTVNDKCGINSQTFFQKLTFSHFSIDKAGEHVYSLKSFIILFAELLIYTYPCSEEMKCLLFSATLICIELNTVFFIPRCIYPLHIFNFYLFFEQLHSHRQENFQRFAEWFVVTPLFVLSSFSSASLQPLGKIF